jgi:opacity protein-like surface antigen
MQEALRKMKKSIAILALLVASAATPVLVKAQDVPLVEGYAGYDFLRVNATTRLPGVAPSFSFNANGGGGQLEVNVNRWLGIVGDLAGYSVDNPTAHGEAFSYLFGPRINFRYSRVTPFVHVLFGGLLASDGIGSFGPENHFAMAAGGGIDFKVSRRFAVRPVQAEYFMTKFPDGLNNRQNNFRFSTGIVLLLGRR